MAKFLSALAVISAVLVMFSMPLIFGLYVFIIHIPGFTANQLVAITLVALFLQVLLTGFAVVLAVLSFLFPPRD